MTPQYIQRTSLTLLYAILWLKHWSEKGLLFHKSSDYFFSNDMCDGEHHTGTGVYACSPEPSHVAHTL